jgi:hypothetical protein
MNLCISRLSDTSVAAAAQSGRCDLMPLPLARQIAADQRGDLVVRRSGSHQPFHIVLFDREQALAQFAIGRDAQAVAVHAERAAHRRDEAHAAAAIGVLIFGGGRARVAVRRRKMRRNRATASR